MRVLKTIAFVDGAMLLIDTIEYDDELWLVPEWRELPSEGVQWPARIICLSQLRHSEMGDIEGAPPHFSLTDSMPKSVLDGKIPKGLEGEYILLENPPIRIPTGPGHH